MLGNSQHLVVDLMNILQFMIIGKTIDACILINSDCFAIEN